MTPLYETRELDVASFLKATGHKLLKAEQRGPLIVFSFEQSAAIAVEDYLNGTHISAMRLFEAHRTLRTLIIKLKSHETNRSHIGSTDSKQNIFASNSSITQ